MLHPKCMASLLDADSRATMVGFLPTTSTHDQQVLFSFDQSFRDEHGDRLKMLFKHDLTTGKTVDMGVVYFWHADTEATYEYTLMNRDNDDMGKYSPVAIRVDRKPFLDKAACAFEAGHATNGLVSTVQSVTIPLSEDEQDQRHDRPDKRGGFCCMNFETEGDKALLSTTWKNHLIFIDFAEERATWEEWPSTPVAVLNTSSLQLRWTQQLVSLAGGQQQQPSLGKDELGIVASYCLGVLLTPSSSSSSS